MEKKTAFMVILFLIFLPQVAYTDIEDDIKKYPKCKYCQMNRKHYSATRILIRYEGGMEYGLCSIHCAAVDMAVHIDLPVESLLVADYYTKRLIDSESAHWVIGGNIAGVMAKRGKWAFSNKTQAEKFINEHGGKSASLEEVMEATYVDMHRDSKMLRSKLKIRKMHEGDQGKSH